MSHRTQPDPFRGTALSGMALLLAFVVFPGCAPAPDDTGASVAQPSAPWFEERAGAAGLDFTHHSGQSDRLLFPEIMGGGAALFDMDGDGDLDAYFVQSGRLGVAGEVNRLFANDGHGMFRDVTEGSGAGDPGYGNGVAAADYDADGDVDLFVTNVGPNVLLANDGNGKFVDVTAHAGVGDGGWGTSAAFLDYDADGDLDLFVVNYINWLQRNELDCYNAAGRPDYCLPTNYDAPARDLLYRNDGDGRLTDVSVQAGLQAAFGNGLGIACADFTLDGRVDVFVANDTMLNQLWVNQGDGTFRDESLLRGSALDEHGQAKAGMGVAAADYDDDGDPDLLVVNLQGQTDSFFRNDGGYFSDGTGQAGLGASSRFYTRFGVGLQDFDNDGWLDLYEANGRVGRLAEPNTDDPYAEPNLLFRGGADGRFTEVLPRGGTTEPLFGTSRAAAFGDVDGDGGVDVLVVNRDAPAYLLRNVVARRGNWVSLQVLERTGGDAIGATVKLTLGPRSVTRDVRSGYSYQASSDPRVHIGLGRLETVGDVEVRWSDGRTQSFPPPTINTVNVLRRS